MKAGRFINKGTTGCVFKDPPLKCKDESERRPNLVSKLMAKYKANDERISNSFFKRFDASSNYFITEEHVCEFDETSINATNEIDKCHDVTANRTIVPRPITDRTLIFYADGGTDLNNLTLNSADYIPFFEGLCNLFEGLILAHANQTYHLDIKLENAVLLKNGVIHPRFIDFGLSAYSVDTFHTIPFQSVYRFWPLESLYINNPHEFDRNKYNVWYNQFDTNMRYSSVLTLEYWEANTSRNYTFSLAKSILDPLQSYFNDMACLEKVDVYMFGLMLSLLMTHLTRHVMNIHPHTGKVVARVDGALTSNMSGDYKDWHTDVEENITVPFTRICLDMVRLDPRVRPSISDCYETYKEILPSIRRLFTSSNIERFLPIVGVSLSSTQVARHSRKTRKGRRNGTLRKRKA